MKINEMKQQIFKDIKRVEEELQMLAESRQILTSGELWYN